MFEENDIVQVKEYYFSVTFHGRQIRHKHYVDFLVGNDVLIECKAIEQIGLEQRQQLWTKLLAICTHSNLFNKILKNCAKLFCLRNLGI